MEKKIGFIGCGNMGTAMIQGILESGKCPPQEMMISCRTKKTLEEKKAQFGVQISTDNRDVAAFADILFVAVKPQFYAEVLEEIKETTLKEMLNKHPERVIEFAVKGMLPKGPLGRQMYTKLFVYAGPDHKHAAQKPEALTF